MKRPRFRLTSPTAAQIAKATRPKEIQIHCAYVAWCRRMQGLHPELARGFHPPNGEARDAITGAKLKRMGVRASVLDWCLPVPRGGHHGLFIEFKRSGEKPTPGQSVEIAALRADGYRVEVFDDWAQAAEFTAGYLKS